MSAASLAGLGLRLALASDPPADPYLDPSSPPDREYAEGASAPTLDGRYSFCREGRDYPASSSERPWCGRVDATRCPGLARACAMPSALDTNETHSDPRDGKSTTPGAKDSVRDDTLFDEDAPLEVPAGIARALLWVLGALATLLIVVAVWRGRRRTAALASNTTQTEVTRVVSQTHVVADHRNEGAQALLHHATRLIELGDYVGATDLCHRALLVGLHEQGATVLDPARTNGEHLRAASAANPSIRQRLRQAFRQVESVHFGHQEPTQPSASTLVAAVGNVLASWTTRAGIGLACLLSLSLACVAPGRNDSNLTGLGTDTDGLRVMGELLTRRGVTVQHRTAALEQLGDDTKALLLTGQRHLDTEEWDALLRWTEAGGHLYIALDSSFDERVPIQTTYVGERALAPHYLADRVEVDGGLVGHAPVTRRIADDATGAPMRVLVLAGAVLAEEPFSGWDARDDRGVLGEATLVDDQEPDKHVYRNVVASVAHGSGSVVVFADPRLLSNLAFAVEGNAELVTELFVHEPSLEITTAHTGGGAATPLEAVANAHLLPAILQLGLLFLLVFLWRGTPLLPLRDPSSASRLAFADHVRALAEQYARARAPSAALVHYAAWATDRMRERVRHRLRGRAWSELASRLGEASGRDEREILNILLEADLPDEATADENTEPAYGASPERSLADAGATMNRISALLRQVQGAKQR